VIQYIRIAVAASDTKRLPYNASARALPLLIVPVLSLELVAPLYP